MKFLSPTTDTAFKRLFGDEHRKNLTINFLNNLLERKDGNLISVIKFRDTANTPEAIDRKMSYLDIYCTDQNKNHFIIEMQVAKEVYFLQRALFYASSVLARQLKKAESYEPLEPVIFIGVMSKELLYDNKDAITHHLICNTKTGKQSIRHMEFHFVELDNFHKKLHELTSVLDKWLYFLKHADDLKAIPQEFADSPNFQEAFHVIEKALWSQDDLIKYRADLDRIHREVRVQEGIFEQGVQAKAEAMAVKLLAEGFDNNFITKMTDLSIDHIENLRIQVR